MKYLIFLLLSQVAYAADCPDCAKISALEVRMAKVKPNPLNSATIDRQTKIVEDGDDLMKANLTDERFTPEVATPLVMMILHIIPYDTARYTADYNQAAFQKLYGEPNSLLKKTIEDFVSKKFITPADRTTLLNAFGLQD